MARKRVAPATSINTHIDNRLLKAAERVAVVWRGRANVLNAALLALLRMPEEDQQALMVAYAMFAGDPKATVEVREKARAR